MNPRIAVPVVAALLAGFAVSAAATVMPVSGTFSIAFPATPKLTLSGSGIGASDGFGAAALVPADLFAGNPRVVVPISPTGTYLTNITFPANSVNNPAGVFDPNGAMGLSGSMFFSNGWGGSIAIFPLGGGGKVRGVFGGAYVDLVGATWQYAVSKVFKGTGMGAFLPLTVKATAFDNRTAGGRGTIQLVAPGAIDLGGSSGTLPVFATLSLSYTPEPGTLLLLGTGVALLAAVGRERVRH